MDEIQNNLANEKPLEPSLASKTLQDQGNIGIDASAIQAGNTIIVSWNAVANEAAYWVEIKRHNRGNGVTTIVISHQGTMPPFRDHTVVKGASYWYEIIISHNGQVISVQNTPTVSVNTTSRLPIGFDWRGLDDGELENLAQTIAATQAERQQAVQVQQVNTQQQEHLGE